MENGEWGSENGSRFYAAMILEQSPRALSLMDRDAMSPTAGCCDRAYWAWKFVDFPGARFQEALCALSFLYATEIDGNPYFHNARLLEWIGLGLRFWSSIQHRDGSFDEAYPFERSLAATAFTTFYVGEALEFLGDHLSSDLRAGTQETMRRAGWWLARNDETHGFLSNHLAAAAAALHHVYRVTLEKSFAQRSRYFLDKILDRQSSEGWYEEYGGADPGYQTHGSFYLARVWQLTRDEQLMKSLCHSMSFLAHFAHPDGSLGGEYASRNTQTYYPAAFEMFASVDPAAAWIAETMRPSLGGGAAAGLRCIDAQNFFPCLNNLVFAYLATKSERTAPAPDESSSRPGLVWFPEAGLARVRREAFDAFVGTAKGGVIKVFDRARNKLVYSDCGYIGRLNNGRLISTQYQDHARKVRVEAERIEVEGVFLEVSRPTMTALRFTAFRLFTLSVGRLAVLGRWLKRRLVKVLIHNQRMARIHFKRVITFDDFSVCVRDEIGGPDGADGGRVESIRWGESFSTIHMGSSRYFITNELGLPAALNPVLDWDGAPDIDPERIVKGVSLRRVVTFDQAAGGVCVSRSL
ncbi:MAG TPA: hypothetical protein VJ810_04070 [Blastocatellia bacterium]|nr:hypothetical protein [Blastocatellia bacterium]